MSERFLIPAIRLKRDSDSNNYYYDSNDLKRLKDSHQGIIDHYSKLFEGDKPMMKDLPRYGYYMKLHSAAGNIAIKLGHMYALAIYDDLNEELYDMMVIRCVESILHLGKLFNDIQMIRERTTDRYQ